LGKILEVSNVSTAYGNVQVLWSISFSVNEGSVAAIIGSNGAGKTTTLRAIIGLLPILSGRIVYLGRDLTNLSIKHRVELGITLVPEGRALFPYMTVLENLKMGAYTKRGREKADETIKRVFELFPILKERKGQLAQTLSGGEQQMLAIARGLMSSPKLLLIDEMSQGLAPKLVHRLFEALTEITHSGVTILLVEQNVHYALRYADEAYVLENGRIVMEGKSDELASNPRIKEAYLGL
jgi:branched-chain amino acid transport system ATP-binding protein